MANRPGGVEMNERIRELAEQAGFYPDPNWDHTDWHAAGHSDLFEKFAELIVRECAAVANINSHQWQVPGDFVLKHFGVEE